MVLPVDEDELFDSCGKERRTGRLREMSAFSERRVAGLWAWDGGWEWLWAER